MSHDRAPQFVSDQTRAKSDVLSESTDLDSLLAAILGEERPDAAVSARAEPLRAPAPLENQPDDEVAENGSSTVEWIDPGPRAEPVASGIARHSRPAPQIATHPASRTGVPRVATFGLRASPPWLMIVGIGVAGAGLVAGAIALQGNRSESLPALASPRATAPPATVEPTPDVTGTRDGSVTPAVDPSLAAARAKAGAPLPRAGAASPPSAVVPPPRSSAAAAQSSSTAPSARARNSDEAEAPPTGAPATLGPPRSTNEAGPAVADDPPAPEPVAVALSTSTPTVFASPPPSAAADPAVTAPRAPAAAATVTRAVARQVNRSAPEYSNALRAAKVGGTVAVSFTIDASGRVTNARALSGPSPLRAAAEKAVRQWQYEPATLNGVPVESEANVQFTFNPNTPRPQ